MIFFAGSPFLKALGWALLNSIWQFGVMWLLFWTLTAVLKKSTAAVRHTLALCLLGAGSIWFLAGLSWKYYSYPSAAADTENSFAIANTIYYNAYHAIEQSMDGLMPYWSLLYLLCIIVLFVKFCLFLRETENMQTKGISKMTADWRVYVQKIACQLGIEKKLEVVLSSRVDTPQVIGFLKPVILVPLACMNHLTIEQLEAVLLHELVHIKRNDYLVNIFMATAEILFFFNPFVKQLVAALRKEREYSCDDMVIQFRYQPHNYATALLELEKNRKTQQLTFAIASNGQNQKQLLARVQRIVGIKSKQQNFSQVSGYLIAVLLLGFIAMVNPAKIAVDKVAPVLATLTGHPVNNATAINKEANLIVTNKPVVTLTLKKPVHKITVADKNDDLIRDEVAEEAHNALAAELQQAASTMDNMAAVNMQTAVATETRDFSLPENNAVAAMPGLNDYPSIATPYVPSNSFSYQFVPDSTQPRMKRATYEEQRARESMAKTRQALNAINWKSIEKNLHYDKRKLARLKAELAKQMSELDWQKINKEVQDELKAEELLTFKKTLQQQEAVKLYQQTEATYQDLQKQILEKEQFIKEADKRTMEQVKALEDKQKKVQLELKQRRIIYL